MTGDLPADPALPGLCELFPPQGAPRFVAEALTAATGRPFEAARAQSRFVRYRPGKNCVVLWSFAGADGPAHVSGTLFRDDHGGETVRKRSFRRLAERLRASHPQAATPFAYLPDRRLLLQLAPLDLRLPALIDALQPSWVREVLAPALGVPSAEVARIELLGGSFKPWRRAVVKYVLRHEGSEQRYFGKLYRDDRAARLLNTLRAIHEQLGAAGAAWNVPPPAVHIAGARMLLFLAADGGEALTLDSDIDGATWVARLAAGLPLFQRTSVDGLPGRPPIAIVQGLRKSARGLDKVDTVFARLVDRQLQALDEDAARLPAEPLVATHGALRHGQLMISGDTLTVFDLDTICLSGVSADAGNFLGCLDVTALRRPRLRATAERWARAFEDELGRHRICSPHWLDWYRRAAWVKMALRSFFALDARWRETAEALLTRKPEEAPAI